MRTRQFRSDHNRDLVGETADAGSPDAGPVRDSRADDAAAPGAGGAQPAGTPPDMNADDPVTGEPDLLPSRPAEGELAR